MLNIKKGNIIKIFVFIVIVYFGNNILRYITIEYSIYKFNWGTEGEHTKAYLNIVDYGESALLQLSDHINLKGKKPYMEEDWVLSCIRSITKKNYGLKFDPGKIVDSDTVFSLDSFYNEESYDSIKVEIVAFIKDNY